MFVALSNLKQDVTLELLLKIQLDNQRKESHKRKPIDLKENKVFIMTIV